MENCLNETQLQSKCFIWFHNNYPQHRGLLFHIQQKATNAIEGNKFKSMGVVSGVSDMIFVWYCMVVFIEFKFNNGAQSDTQKRFQQLVTEKGHQYYIVRTEHEFQTLIKSLINGATIA